MTQKLLFISMLGELAHFNPEFYSDLCSSGFESDWIVDWHGEVASQFGLEMVSVDICRGDSLAPVDDVCSVVLGGTMHVVAEDKQWLHDLRSWLTEYRETGRPLLAICGGHQMLASQFGDGQLVVREQGVLAGTHPVKLTELGKTHPLFNGLPENPQFHFGNSLEIIPSDEQTQKVLCAQEINSATALDHGGNWFSCQFHPESKKEFWDIYVSALDGYSINDYSADHSGQQLLENFFQLSSSKVRGSGL